jgi:hypothetical protein
LCCFGSGASAFALTINPTSDPNVLTNAFLSSGIAVTIITSSYSGAGSASATYSQGPLGISDGMLLTSGEANLALPPSEPFKVSKQNNQPGDPLCDALIPGFPSLDAAKLTIQFLLAPGFNGISFQFIFGSDEYPEFVGGSFADVLGVYLDGTQVAFDAGGNPITINGAFFTGGNVVSGAATETEYDGSTSLLTTQAPTLPGLHTLQIVICDGGDQSVDSGVFMAGLSGCIGGGCMGTTSCGSIDNDADGATACVDCDDADPTANPGSSEVCDGKDNDCDGAIDQGDPGGGLACSTGLSGVCDAGTTSCAGGVTMCTASTAPGSTPEICDNGIDEDCNGTADDDPSCGAGGGGGGGATGSGGGGAGGGGGGSSSSSGGGSSSSSGGNDDGFYGSGTGLLCSMRSEKSEGSWSAWVLALAAGAMAYRRRRAAS